MKIKPLTAALPVALAATLATLAPRPAAAANAAAAGAAGMSPSAADPASLVGKPAPAFTLPDQNDKTRSLAGHKGKWVLLAFYPKDMTKG